VGKLVEEEKNAGKHFFCLKPLNTANKAMDKPIGIANTRS